MARLRAFPDELKGHEGGAARFDGREVRAWSRTLYDGGWVGISWPEEFGGRGLAPRFQAIYLEEEARAEAPPHLGVIGLGMAGPTIISRGTDAQKQRYLQPLLAADEIWCQGFSEPDAGSDLAGVRASARLDGDRFVVDGQKVWSSYAHIADYCILLARSDPDSERHAGLTYLIVDMHAPGVDVRPLTQITGEAEFNEIFLSGVEVPLENVIGEIGGGWDVAMTTLLHERGTLGFALVARLEVQVGKLVELARDRGATAGQREAIAREWIDLQALRVDGEPLALGAREDGYPGPRGLDPQAPLVGGEPARDEARARAARPRRAAPRAERAVRRLLARPAAPEPREHDRGRHLGDPAEHRRRAGARAAEESLMDLSFTPLQDELRAQARSFLAANPEPSWAQLAELGWTGATVAEEHDGAGLGFLDEAVLHEEAGRALLHAPLWSTSSLLPYPAGRRSGGRRRRGDQLDARARPARPRSRHRDERRHGRRRHGVGARRRRA